MTALLCWRPAAAPVLVVRPEVVTVWVREAEQRPLLRSLFRRGPRRCLRGQPGPSDLPWQLCPSGLRVRGRDGLGVYPAPCFPCGGLYRGLGLDRSQGVQSLHFVFFRSVCGCPFLFSPSPRSVSGSCPARKVVRPPCPG